MKHLRRGLTSTLLLGALAGCSLKASPPPLHEDGEALYRDACANCHGADGKGGGPASVTTTTRPSDLTQLSRRNDGAFPRQRVIEVLAGEVAVPAHGPRDMPVWSQRFAPRDEGATAVAAIYARRQLEGLADYLETIQSAPPK